MNRNVCGLLGVVFAGSGLVYGGPAAAQMQPLLPLLINTTGGNNQSTGYSGRYVDGIAGVEGQLKIDGTMASLSISRTVEGEWKP